MNTETILLPCPHCSGEADWAHSNKMKMRVFCKECGAEVSQKRTTRVTFEFLKNAVFSMWNRRALQPKVVAKPIEWVTQTAEGPWYSTNLKHRIVKIEVGFEWQQKLPKPALEKWEPMFSLETFESIEAFINEYQQLEVNRAIEDCDIVITPTQKHA